MPSLTQDCISEIELYRTYALRSLRRKFMEQSCRVCGEVMSENSINQAFQDSYGFAFGWPDGEPELLSDVYWSDHWLTWVHAGCEQAFGSGLTAAEYSMK